MYLSYTCFSEENQMQREKNRDEKIMKKRTRKRNSRGEGVERNIAAFNNAPLKELVLWSIQQLIKATFKVLL
jgi:hypothetical protein